MMTEHTPGPWKVHSRARGYGYVRDRSERPICGFGSGSLSNDESAANAHLIAAAPDMLEALQAMLKDPPATLDEPDPDGELIGKMRAIARTAIAKATGK